MLLPSTWGPLNLHYISQITYKVTFEDISAGPQGLRIVAFCPTTKHQCTFYDVCFKSSVTRFLPIHSIIWKLWTALTWGWLQGFPCCPSWCTSSLSRFVRRPVYRRYIRPHRKLSPAEFLQTPPPAERKAEEEKMKKILDGNLLKDFKIS